MRSPTYYGIKRTGLCKVSGAHLSDAPNEPASFSQDELLAGDKERAEFSVQREVDRAHEDEVQRLRCLGGI